ncbi:hypothetical protein ACTSNL_000663 [Salmonella enterica subsp. enterica]
MSFINNYPELVILLPFIIVFIVIAIRSLFIKGECGQTTTNDYDPVDFADVVRDAYYTKEELDEIDAMSIEELDAYFSDDVE